MAHITSQTSMRRRPATLQDVDSMATIVYEAMKSDPEWKYRYPARRFYPEDTYGYTRLMMRSILEDDSNVVDVVTFSSPGIPEEDELPAALAVWTTPKTWEVPCKYISSLIMTLFTNL